MERAGTVEETIAESRSENVVPRSASRPASLPASSSAVSSRTVRKRQCSTSSAPRKVPKWVWVLPTSTTRSMCQHDPTMPKASLYVVPASHPCATAARALEFKGIPYRTIELPPGMHAPFQKLRFGKRTVPGLRMGRRRISGSREILRALDIVRPEPPLLPADTQKRTRVLEAEAWGDQILQDGVRRIIWAALPSDPAAAHSYLAESKLPFRPGTTARLMPATAWVERKLNGLTDAQLRADLEALPGWLGPLGGG